MSSFILHNVGLQEGVGLVTKLCKSVFIEKGVITKISDASTIDSTTLENQNVVDGTGKTLMPGLVFAHTHIAYDSVCGARDVLFKHPLTKLSYIAAQVAKRASQLGYTTMVGAGSVSGIDVYLRDTIDNGLFDGPHIIPCSRDIMAAGPIGKRSKEKVAHIPPDYMPVLTEQEEIEDTVNREIDDGAKIIKTFATGDDQFPNANSCEELFSQEELEEIVLHAHNRKILVRCHARGLNGIKNSIKAGVDIIDHATYADQDSLEQILEKGITLVPSYYQPKQYIEHGHKYGKHPEESNFDLEIENIAKILPIAEKMGINIAVGDDFGFAWTPHGTYHQELISYQNDLDIPAPMIIKWATYNGAKMIGQEHRIGELAEGKQADMILLGEDPALNIEALSNKIEKVFISGKDIQL